MSAPHTTPAKPAPSQAHSGTARHDNSTPSDTTPREELASVEGLRELLAEVERRHGKSWERSLREVAEGYPLPALKNQAEWLLTVQLRVALLDIAEENGRLREALKPFAEAADNLDDSDHDPHSLWEGPESMMLTCGDLRRARSALSPKETAPSNLPAEGPKA